MTASAIHHIRHQEYPISPTNNSEADNKIICFSFFKFQNGLQDVRANSTYVIYGVTDGGIFFNFSNDDVLTSGFVMFLVV